MTLNNKSLLIVVLNLSCLPTFSQTKPTCTDLQNGIFHNYPISANKHYLVRREGDEQTETDLATGDSSLWKVKWIEDCVYEMKYVSGSKVDEAILKVLKKHKFVYEITRITKDYYVYKGYLDNTSNNPIQSDTMWLSERVNIANNEIFRQIEDESVLRKAHFRDTSKYAVLYLYRPGKLTNSAGNYIVYLNDNIMCVAQNNSGYIFKILKEGEVTIASRLYKDESSVKLDIKFGKIYFVKSMVHWGITKRLYNFKLDMAVMDPEKGRDEFDKTDLK